MRTVVESYGYGYGYGYWYGYGTHGNSKRSEIDSNRIYGVACISVTSLKLHDVTVALLKYGRYMNKLEL